MSGHCVLIQGSMFLSVLSSKFFRAKKVSGQQNYGLHSRTATSPFCGTWHDRFKVLRTQSVLQLSQSRGPLGENQALNFGIFRENFLNGAHHAINLGADRGILSGQWLDVVGPVETKKNNAHHAYITMSNRKQIDHNCSFFPARPKWRWFRPSPHSSGSPSSPPAPSPRSCRSHALGTPRGRRPSAAPSAHRRKYTAPEVRRKYRVKAARQPRERWVKGRIWKIYGKPWFYHGLSVKYWRCPEKCEPNL